MNRLSIGQIKGRNGHDLGTFSFDWQSLMFRNTPGTGTIALEKKQTS